MYILLLFLFFLYWYGPFVWNKVDNSQCQSIAVQQYSNKLVSEVKPYIGPLSTSFSNFSRNLGVIVNQNLNFDSHIHKLTQTCFIPLRILLVALAWFGCPSSRGLESLIHTFIFSQLDYCNGIFSCLIQAVLLCWQLMQNAAARLLTKPAADHLYLYLHMIPILH